MQPLPHIDISRLREIGRGQWDALDESDGDALAAGRYDRYLATAAVRLWNGESEDDVADYLVTVETEGLGLDTGTGMRERAVDLASGLRRYLDSFRRQRRPAEAQF